MVPPSPPQTFVQQIVGALSYVKVPLKFSFSPRSPYQIHCRFIALCCNEQRARARRKRRDKFIRVCVSAGWQTGEQ